ncbi:DUF4153 domain-containing protein [Mucilaginibacter sp. KACC 22063]|uniref:DUF4153 domain-containing protein n=1 Tax=Mucilaginibacter sp. KACC 22063 TaxID=3025666 RepID=UPI0023651DEC|nr:DUF4153 domain-containing protein [Mucilaginibacter sp. KACC 22063]WDF57383.1 DUF4153 domain-containing protein [Mucilaginibacter sp. KACC 22063]
MAFQLPSVNHIISSVASTIRRYPFEFLFALAGTWSAIHLSSGYLYGYASHSWYIRILMMAAVGMPLSLAVSLYGRNNGFSGNRRLLVRCVAVAVGVVFLFILKPETYPQHYVVFALLLIAMHLLVSFAAFTGKNNTLAFWEFNKTLFIRFLTGLLYSVVLGAGLSAAFGVVERIFGFSLNWVYQPVWFIILGVFNTLFFLSGVPEGNLQAESLIAYPKGLKFFSQYILVPLATVYLIILLVYEVKILIEWELPKGLVSGLILGYAGLGLLALLLVYPLRDQEDNGWIKVYGRYFYLFLLPLVALLILAISKRIGSYGITQYRYFLMVLAAWLLFLIGYFLLHKKATIKAIPVSLFIIVMLIIYGPQSATSVSLNSQRAVLYELFKEAGLIKKGKLQPIDQKKVKPYIAARMASTVNYILQHYDFQSMQPLLSVNLQAKEQELRISWKNKMYDIPDENGFNFDRINWMQNYLGLSGYEYMQQYSEDRMDMDLNTNYYVRSKQTAYPLKGYDYMMVKETYVDTLSVDTVKGYAIKQGDSFDYDDMIINVGENKFTFPLKVLADQIVKETVNLKPVENTATRQGLDKQYLLPQQMLQIKQSKMGITVMAQVQELSFENTKRNGIKINSARAYYFIKMDK